MKKIIYKSKAIQAVIIIVAACALLSLFPFRVWHETVTSSIPQQTGEVIGPIDDNRMLTQGFAAQYDHMGSVRIYLGAETTGESFYFRMLDSANCGMFEETVMIDQDNLPGFYEILVDVDLTVGEMYFFIVQGKTPSGKPDGGIVSNIYAGSEFIPMTDYPNAGVMYYMDSSLEGLNLVADYNYSVPLRKDKVALFGAVILALAAAMLFAVNYYYKKRQAKDKLITVERAFKFVMNPLAAVLILAGLIATVTGAFGSFVLDNTFFFISIILLGGILFYGINHNRDGQAAIISKDILREKWPDFLQSIFIAGILAACCEYMCGLYDIHHTIAERKEVIFFALAIIVMFSKKEIWKIYNLVYVILAGIYGYNYYTGLMTDELRANELDAQALPLTVWAGILAGFVILNVIINTVKKIISREMKRPAYLYGGLIALFFILIIVFRNGRWWTVALAVSFTLFFLQYGGWKKTDILTNICRGIALHFIWSTGYALLHRPFVTYRTARYTHIFHTVTITATYLTMVECAALVILLTKLKKSHKLKDIWKESVFFGVVTSYMLFTMARTGFFAVAVTALFAVVIMAAGKGREKIRNILVSMGIMILSAIICFPVTFFVQRTVPALVSEPELYEFESYPDDILRGRKVNSVEFMRVGRFVDVFAEKIFGIPEGTFDIYGEIKEFEETHIIVSEVYVELWEAEAMGVETEQAVTAEQDQVVEAEADVPEADYTNGRTDIFRSYIEQLNMTGHEEMGALLKDGSIATHAHNIYLQFAYDHGIFMGVLFVLVGLATFIQSCIYYFRNRDNESYAALPVIVTVAVAVEGLVEWVFHFSNPSGLILMLIIAPLIFNSKKGRNL